MTNARQISIEALTRAKRGGDLGNVIVTTPGFAALSPSDKAFCFTLVFNTFRYRRPIQELLKPLLQKPVPETIANILEVGVVSLKVLLTPNYAAVNEMVTIAPQGFKGLVNAVLKRADALPLPKTHYLPTEIIKFLPQDRVEAIDAMMVAVPPVDISVKEQYRKEIDSLPELFIPLSGNTYTVNAPTRDLTTLPGFKEGWWWVQDRAAALPVTWFSDVKGARVADICAAPGGKTAQLLDLGAEVTAFDIAHKRMQTLRENIARLKMKAAFVQADPKTYKGELFDKVLLDAPCSATGTFRRNPDAVFKNLDAELAKVQKELIKTALNMLKPDGELIYCVCSLLPYEGEGIIETVADKVKVIKTMRTFPDENRDGFFICLMNKI